MKWIASLLPADRALDDEASEHLMACTRPTLLQLDVENALDAAAVAIEAKCFVFAITMP